MKIIRTDYEILEWHFQPKEQQTDKFNEVLQHLTTENLFRAHATDKDKAIYTVITPVVGENHAYTLHGRMQIFFYLEELPANDTATLKSLVLQNKTWIQAACTSLINEAMRQFAARTPIGHMAGYLVVENLTFEN
jgi:hypothetical protein